MKKLWLGLAVVCATSVATAAGWMTDFTAAQNKAKAENKKMLVLFTGSDWCPACIQLKNTALSHDAFKSYAEQHVILTEIDFPRRKPVGAAQRKANDALAARYGIEYYPTLLLIDGAGAKVAEVSAVPDGPQLVQEIQKGLGQRPGAVAKTKESPKVNDTPPPLFNGATVKPPPQYSELKLQGISGSAKRKLAIVNSQTLGVGESAHVKIGGKDVAIRCVEIREKSVLLAVDGHHQEVRGNW